MIKNFLKNPFIPDVYCFQIRFDFEKIKDTENDREILRLFGIDKDRLLINEEDYLEDYSSYENKKLFFIELYNTLIIKAHEIFILQSIGESSLDEVKTKVNESSLKDYIQCSEIDKMGEIHFIKLLYPYILEKYINSLGDTFSDIYDKILTTIRFYKIALKEKSSSNFYYISFLILALVLEQLLHIIAIKENMSLKDGFSIGSHVKTLKGNSFLVVQHPNGVSKNEDGKKNLTIYYESSNQTNIFTKQNSDEGKRVIKLLNDINKIRTKYIHYTLEEPNNPSDCLLGIINLGQFMIWCEDNGYL